MQVYAFAREAAQWQDLLPESATFSVDARALRGATVTEAFLRMRTRDAVCDACSDARHVPGDLPAALIGLCNESLAQLAGAP